jgi:hypothetical protein
MHSRSQKVLAVAFLATALCADRAINAAPSLRSESPTGTFAGRLVARLTGNLRRVVPAARVYQVRREERATQQHTLMPVAPLVARVPISPFQFRLPPPIC